MVFGRAVKLDSSRRVRGADFDALAALVSHDVPDDLRARLIDDVQEVTQTIGFRATTPARAGSAARCELVRGDRIGGAVDVLPPAPSSGLEGTVGRHVASGLEHHCSERWAKLGARPPPSPARVVPQVHRHQRHRCSSEL